MTVIRPNSVSGITSITAQANEINFFRSNGTLAGLQLNGVNFNTTTGVSTFNNLDVGGVLTYQDVTNVDSVGIITARSTIDAQGDVSIADKIIHTGDTNTAIRFPAVDTISFETSGSERVRITSGGNVGIGTDNPATKTAIVGSDSGDVYLQIANSTTGSDSNSGFLVGLKSDEGATLYQMENNYMRFGTNGAERLRIDAGGGLQLGTSTATASKLTVYGANDAAAIFQGSGTGTGAGNGLLVGNNGGTTGLLWNYENGNTLFATNNIERLRITADGKVGINQDTPLAGLHVGTESGNNVAFQVGTISGQNRYLTINHFNNQQNFYQMKMRCNDNQLIPMLDLGNPYGSTGHGTKIKFSGYQDNECASIEVVNTANNNANAAEMRFKTGGTTEKLRITSAGSVLSSTNFVSKATADVNVTISTASGFTANTYVTVINHGVLEEESVYIISFKWNHGSSGQQPYFSHGAFVFNPSAVNTGSTGGQGQNHIPFQGHHMHTGVNRYWSFRYYGATGGTSVHGLQAAFDQTLGNGTFTIRATKIAKVTTI